MAHRECNCLVCGFHIGCVEITDDENKRETLNNTYPLCQGCFDRHFPNVPKWIPGQISKK
jgi:hypothetical protein